MLSAIGTRTYSACQAANRVSGPVKAEQKIVRLQILVTCEAAWLTALRLFLCLLAYSKPNLNDAAAMLAVLNLLKQPCSCLCSCLKAPVTMPNGARSSYALSVGMLPFRLGIQCLHVLHAACTQAACIQPATTTPRNQSATAAQPLQISVSRQEKVC